MSFSQRITTFTLPPIRHHRPLYYHLRPYASSSSSNPTSRPTSPSTSDPDPDSEPIPIPTQLLGSRRSLEQKQRQMKEKYKVALDKRMREENVSTLTDLQARLKARQVSSTTNTSSESTSIPLRSGSRTSTPTTSPTPPPTTTTTTTTTTTSTGKEGRSTGPSQATQVDRRRKADDQVYADRAGIKPLSQILNLPLIYSSPHSSTSISTLWQTYHSAHPTLSPTFLSAIIPPATYAGMVRLARERPMFVLPLPRESPGSSGMVGGEEKGWEMFFLQWTFHPTPSLALEDVTTTRTTPRLPASSVMFTSLEEYKQKGEWARPFLVLTHYPDLHNNPIGHPAPPSSTPSPGANGGSIVEVNPTALAAQNHPLILMRGEISPSSTKPPLSALPSTDLSLTQAEAQLLALGLQRFYCSTLDVPGEGEEARRERRERERSLRGFGGEGWDWKGLGRMAFGGVV